LPLGADYWQASRLVMALALVWLAHIGLDRLLGTGLKYNDRFTHTQIRHKVMIGSNGLDLKRCVDELNELPLRDASKERILRQNAIEFLGL
jgi:hypothetical protein